MHLRAVTLLLARLTISPGRAHFYLLCGHVAIAGVIAKARVLWHCQH